MSLIRSEGRRITWNDVPSEHADSPDSANPLLDKKKSLLEPATKNLDSRPARPDLRYVRCQMKSV